MPGLQGDISWNGIVKVTLSSLGPSRMSRRRARLIDNALASYELGEQVYLSGPKSWQRAAESNRDPSQDRPLYITALSARSLRAVLACRMRANHCHVSALDRPARWLNNPAPVSTGGLVVRRSEAVLKEKLMFVVYFNRITQATTVRVSHTRGLSSNKFPRWPSSTDANASWSYTNVYWASIQ